MPETRSRALVSAKNGIRVTKVIQYCSKPRQLRDDHPTLRAHLQPSDAREMAPFRGRCQARHANQQALTKPPHALATVSRARHIIGAESYNAVDPLSMALNSLAYPRT